MSPAVQLWAALLASHTLSAGNSIEQLRYWSDRSGLTMKNLADMYFTVQECDATGAKCLGKSW